MSLKKRKSLQFDGASEIPFSPTEIQQQLKRVLDSPDFDATRQQRAFLNFVVSETLSGNSHDIKGFTVATKVFGRDENFDQAIDPIVSIQANKLRRSLERYYLLSGKDDVVCINIPRGTYVPVFSQLMRPETSPVSRRSRDQDSCAEESWPTVLIKPFQNLTNDPEKNFWGAGFAAELATEINRSKWISVLQYGPEAKGKRSSDKGARFIVDGSIREDKSGVKLVVTLLDANANKQIFSDMQRFDIGISEIIAFQEKVASLVGAKIAGEQGVITRTLSVESKDKHPTQLKTYEAILRYHEYDQTLTPADFLRAFQALETARVAEPECGQVWTFLARLYANIFSLEIPGFDIEDAEKKALEYAEKGARLNPDSQCAWGVLALVRMFYNNIAAARRDIKMAYELNPNSLYLMDGIGYVKTLLGDWEHGPELIRKTIELNPYYKPVVHYALWVNYLRQQDFQNAYLETTGLRRPAVFWYPLVKASTLGLLGKIEEGKKFADDLMKLKPDFQERGRVLIGRYCKFDDITDRVIEGLDKVGVTVD
jgi:TolB-like protein